MPPSPSQCHRQHCDECGSQKKRIAVPLRLPRRATEETASERTQCFRRSSKAPPWWRRALQACPTGWPQPPSTRSQPRQEEGLPAKLARSVIAHRARAANQGRDRQLLSFARRLAHAEDCPEQTEAGAIIWNGRCRACSHSATHHSRASVSW